jgi:hypothetical protein
VSEMGPPTGPLFNSQMVCKYEKPRCKYVDREKPRNSREKPVSSSTLSTTNPTWTDRGAKPGLRGESPATNQQGSTIPSYTTHKRWDQLIIYLIITYKYNTFRL